MKYVITTVAALLLVIGGGVLLAQQLGSDDPEPGTGDAPTSNGPSPSGPSGTSSTSPTGWHQVGDVVATWSEADERSWASWLEPLTTPRLVTTEQERKALLSPVPTAASNADDVRAVDLEKYVLVVGGLNKCNEEGVVEASGSTVRYTIRKVSDVQCVWAPLTVDVWKVARTDLDDGTVTLDDSTPARPKSQGSDASPAA